MRVTLSPARRAALDVLGRVRRREAFGPETLDAVLSASNLSAEDAAFVTRLARGTLASVGTLDEALARSLEKPAALEPRVRDALRMSAYEILFMRTPARAAVHQGVEAAKRARPQAAGLANATLRRLSEDAASFPWGDPSTDTAALARLTAHPAWLAERLVSERGFVAARAMLEADQEPAPLYLWQNPFRGSFEEAVRALTADGAEPVPGPVEGSLEARVPGAAVRGSALREGFVIVTDAAAQIAPRAAGPRAGQVIVDLAAGRGAKTAQLQALAVAGGGPAEVVAVDLHAFKIAVLVERMKQLGVPHVHAIRADSTEALTAAGGPAPASADAVLVDAPCSGLGALRRHPEKRWRVTPADVDSLAALQRRLLEAACVLVRPGGLVVYSTCTVLRQENDDVVRWLLDGERGSSFVIRPVTDVVPSAWAGYGTPEGYFQSFPATDGPDGHFVAVLQRTTD